LKFVKTKTVELCCLAVDQNKKAWKYVPIALPDRQPPLLVLNPQTPLFQTMLQGIPEAPPYIQEQVWEDPITMDIVDMVSCGISGIATEVCERALQGIHRRRGV
jgi:hypothetical protein